MIEITDTLRQEMVEHALAEFPNEACGLLAGSFDGGTAANGRVPGAKASRFHRMTNADASPVTYRLDPKEQLQVFNQIEDAGLEIVGIVHSHTHSEAYPSQTDRNQAFYPEAHYVLLSLTDRANPVLRAYSIRDGEIEEEEVRLV
jgi:[CysO sulfur-carrier protein]-S-L-cysteine hydrolase